MLEKTYINTRYIATMKDLYTKIILAVKLKHYISGIFYTTMEILQDVG